MPLPTYDTNALASIAGGKITQGDPDAKVISVFTDSRRHVRSEGALFVALTGERNDGHRYLKDLYQRGFRLFIVAKDISLPSDATVIRTNNSLLALQAIAAHHRQQAEAQILAITGSNGKTIVKEWLSQVLSEMGQVCRSPRSYNSQLGVPLSVWTLQPNDKFGVFEAGISMPGEMSRLEEILKPELGIFTNIGTAHAENFQDSAHIAREKAILFKSCKTVVYRSDYTVIKKALEAQQPEGQELIDWGNDPSACFVIEAMEAEEDHTVIRGYSQRAAMSGPFRFELPFSDRASVENGIHVYVTGRVLGMAETKLQRALSSLTAVAMRMQVLEGVNRCTLISDSYNNDLYGLNLALDFLDQQDQHRRKTLIISDIEQSGETDETLYQQIAELVAVHDVSRVIGIGAAISAQASAFAESATFYASTDQFLATVSLSDFSDESILLKGGRPFRFEKISRRLQQQAHETVLEVDLGALVHNLNHYRSKISPATRIMGMVKASSYGSGGYEVANVLEYNRADYLAVAYIDEGVELRRAGVRLPIMVMNPEASGLEAMVRYGLEPEIYSFKLLREFCDVLNAAQEAADIAIHLKIDTGMRRLGFNESELNDLIAELKRFPQLTVASMFSHLAAADDPASDDFTRSQIETFKRAAEVLSTALGYQPLRHILNTAGISRFPESQMDMVRLGVGLYGIGLTEADRKELQPVTRLKSTISQIRTVKAGESVGYARMGAVDYDRKVATLPIGYADGFSRAFSNGVGGVSVHGKYAPVVGNVCMDMVMVDLTDIAAAEGDEVEIFGLEQSVDQLAAAAGTIPYEILASISQRVKRVYLQE